MTSESGFWAFVVRAFNWLVTLILPQKIDGSCKNHTINFNDTPSAEEFMSSLFFLFLLKKYFLKIWNHFK